MAVLSWGVVLAGFYSAGALFHLIYKAKSFGRRPVYACPQGSPIRGVIYALGKGMMPWEKESARLHIFTYLAGISFHVGIFSGFMILFSEILSVKIPRLIIGVLFFCLALGMVCGLGLLLKRILKAHARQLSQPDDFGANIFTNIFLATALAASLNDRAAPLFLIYSIFLFIYIPTGKIRHCFLFFFSRIQFGQFFGRRGVIPPRHPRD
jgi:hypothetical protein